MDESSRAEAAKKAMIPLSRTRPECVVFILEVGQLNARSSGPDYLELVHMS